MNNELSQETVKRRWAIHWPKTITLSILELSRSTQTKRDKAHTIICLILLLSTRPLHTEWIAVWQSTQNKRPFGAGRSELSHRGEGRINYHIRPLKLPAHFTGQSVPRVIHINTYVRDKVFASEKLMQQSTENQRAISLAEAKP